jgi:hypothetical protein
VYVIWNAFNPSGDILFKKSTDGGNTFGSMINLSTGTGESTNPLMTVSGKNVYVIWKNGTYNPSGAMWQPEA